MGKKSEQVNLFQKEGVVCPTNVAGRIRSHFQRPLDLAGWTSLLIKMRAVQVGCGMKAMCTNGADSSSQGLDPAVKQEKRLNTDEGKHDSSLKPV